MKKVVKSILVMVVVLMTLNVSANAEKVSLTANSAKSLIFEMDITASKTYVSIVDITGETIFSETIVSSDRYTKKFDLENLPQGNYFLKAEDKLKEITFEISVDDSKVVVLDRKENAKPVFRTKAQKLFLNLLNLEKEKVKIKIFDSTDRIVFEETIEDQVLIEKVFNFASAFSGDYTVVVKHKKNTYYEDVKVD